MECKSINASFDAVSVSPLMGS